jgi:hypothetical protein
MASKNRRQLWLLLVLALASTPLWLELYARWSPDFVASMPEPRNDTRRLILVFHGSDGKDNAAIRQLEQALQSELREPDQEVIRYIWAPWSDNRLRASVNGLYLGQKIGEHLSAYDIDELHLIGHSAGAWLPDAICSNLRANRQTPIKIRITLLDPIGIRGFFNFGWGSQNFGSCADFAEAIINTDDNVPGTNQPLRYAFNIDVTGIPHDMNGHEWPVWYYLENLNGMSLSMETTHFAMPRGAVAEDASASR